MNSEERRENIKSRLENNEDPIKGSTLAEDLGVTRQIIVKDIAILRAKGYKIIATPKGYIINKTNSNAIKRVLAVIHDRDSIEDELQSVVEFGGIVEDVIIEHPLYGEIRGILMIRTLFDVKNFMDKIKNHSAEPLSILTGGVHLHTIRAENEKDMQNIIDELNRKNYIISD
ncbi:transcription repressor NadR [Clostridium felsineum]|uniref:transcription repressor NadR n=1 Tax=Clostridium felsineum TaxID=36839 RepID=UPI00098BF377|nr:transcription repressor NadR [Clostridium felsineum]MCR3758850.1 transcription repressor NadR [Clostridium felsineum]URZ02767.1 putative transcription repressor NiaR [Clostridium felsineum]URZ14111.1 putative transcription repressor NiaR [Clostridium felsineum DSM 794]